MSFVANHPFGAGIAWTFVAVAALALIAILYSFWSGRGAGTRLTGIRSLLGALAGPLVLVILLATIGLFALPADSIADRARLALALPIGSVATFGAAHLGSAAGASEASAVRRGIALNLGALGFALLPVAVGILALQDEHTFAPVAYGAGALIPAVGLSAAAVISSGARRAGASAGVALPGSLQLENDAARAARLAGIAALALGSAASTAPDILGAEGLGAVVLAGAAGLAGAVLGPLLAPVLGDGKGRAPRAVAAGIGTVLTSGIAAALAFLITPPDYIKLNFAGAGSPNLSIGGQSVARSDVYAQLGSITAGIGDILGQTESAAGTLQTAEVLTLATLNPALLLLAGIAVGALAGLAAGWLAGYASAPGRPAILAGARTARVSGPHGHLSSLGAGMLWAAVLVAVPAIAVMLLNRFADGIGQLGLFLIALAAVSAVGAIASFARPASDDDGSTAAAGDTGADAATVIEDAGIAVAGGLAGLGLIGFIRYRMIGFAGHAQTVLDEARITQDTIGSPVVLVGLLGAVIAIALACGILLETTRRTSTASIVLGLAGIATDDPTDLVAATRAERAGAASASDADEDQDEDEAESEDEKPDAGASRRAQSDPADDDSAEESGDRILTWTVRRFGPSRGGVFPVALAVFGGAALSLGLGMTGGAAFMAGIAGVSLLLALIASLAAAFGAGSESLVAGGRYDGPHSVTHRRLAETREALTVLRAVLAGVGVPFALLAAASAALAGPAVVQFVITDPNVFLRIGAALAGAAIVLAFLSYTDSVAQPDLGDEDELVRESMFGKTTD